MEIRGFRPDDLQVIALQPAQAVAVEEMARPEYAVELQRHGPCFTVTRTGEVIACIGVVWKYPTHGHAWALLSAEAGSCMLGITRAVRRWLRFHNAGRIETAVDCDFPAAIRWVEMLGFEREGRMRAFTPDRRDCYLYAQVV